MKDRPIGLDTLGPCRSCVRRPADDAECKSRRALVGDIRSRQSGCRRECRPAVRWKDESASCGRSAKARAHDFKRQASAFGAVATSRLAWTGMHDRLAYAEKDVGGEIRGHTLRNREAQGQRHGPGRSPRTANSRRRSAAGGGELTPISGWPTGLEPRDMNGWRNCRKSREGGPPK